jgi:hypothetical protein
MTKKIKLDLHTHPVLALKEKMGIRGIRDINKEVAASIVKAVKNAGLNGIAITEHNNFNHGWVSALEILDHFPGENLFIFPGSEIDYGGQHYLQIYIPERYRRRIPFFKGKEWFLIMAHPGFYHPLDMSQIGNIDIDAVEEASLLGEFTPTGTISKEKEISIVRSSDAHSLEDIGRYNIEVELA